MSKQRKFLMMLILCVSIGTPLLLFESCQGNNESDASITTMRLHSFESKIKEVTSTGIVINEEPISSTRALSSDDHVVKTIYVDFPDDTPSADIERVKDVESIDDMMLLSHQTAAEFHLDKSNLTKDSLYISETKAKESLTPMIEESKKYLYTKGFTEQDIIEMLKENDADESVLVSFVLTLMEKEQSDKEMLTAHNSNAFYMLATPARAAGIDVDKAKNCAIEALGIDIFYGLTQSTLKTWSVALMKKAFATVAKKIVGPIGTAIFIGEFSWCYYN